MVDFSSALADAVKRSRERLNLTQQQAAEKAGIYKKTLMYIENRKGNPKLETLVILIRALQIDPMEIFYPESMNPSGASDQLRMLISQCSEEDAAKVLTFLPNILEFIKEKKPR